MSPELILALAAVVVSLASLATSVYFGWCSRNHNKRTVKPFPFVLQSDFEDRLRVAVRNNGSGPLVLRRVVAYDTAQGRSGHLIDLIPVPPEALHFKNFSKVHQPRAVLPGETVDLIDLAIALDDLDAVEYRDRLRHFLGRTRVEIDYTDVYESEIPPYTVNLTWFRRHMR